MNGPVIDKVQAANFLMKWWKAFPEPPSLMNVGLLGEIFNHAIYTNASEQERRLIKWNFSACAYRDEFTYLWDHYFGIDLSPLLRGKKVLEIGSSSGGRSIAWFEHYQLAYLVGVDINKEFIDAAMQFAAGHNARTDFALSMGEALPFADNLFDAVLSQETFEHLHDVKQALDECYRVLKPGCHLFIVFPSFWHTREQHIGMVTNFPGLQYLFDPATIIKVYCQILDERGSEASWYRRDSPELCPWERGNTINGTSLTQ